MQPDFWQLEVLRLVQTLSERICRVLSRLDYTPRQFLREMGLEPDEESLRRLDQWKNGEKRPEDCEQLEALARVLDGTSDELQSLVQWEELTHQLERLEKRHDEQTYYVHYHFEDGSIDREEYSGWRATDDVLKRVKLQLDRRTDQEEQPVDSVRVNTPDAETYRLDSTGTIQERCCMDPTLQESPS